MSEPTGRGWYQHAQDPAGVLRWFNGNRWTNSTHGSPRPVDAGQLGNSAGADTRSPAHVSDLNATDLLDAVRGEWRDQLESSEDSLVAWRNGMRMYDEGPAPAQKLNVAEYLTRALAHELFGQSLLSDQDVETSTARVLELTQSIPPELSWQAEAAARLRRLAAALRQKRGWSAPSAPC